MTSPPHAHPVRSLAVVRSLALAAAALRAQEQKSARTCVDLANENAMTQLGSRYLDYHSRSSWEQYPLPSTNHEDVDRAGQERQCAPRLYQYHRPEDDEKRYTRERSTRHQEEPIIESGTPHTTQVAPWKGRDYDADLRARHYHPRSDSFPDRLIPVSTGLLKRQITVNTSRKLEGGAMAQRTKKRIRYLHESDRHNIIKRIEKGEKQATLAREFGVTRAAICHINKNRSEILSRCYAHAKSTEERYSNSPTVAHDTIILEGPDDGYCSKGTETSGKPLRVDKRVHQVRSTSVLLLLTLLRDNRSTGATFRRVAGRLIMIILEETLADLMTEGGKTDPIFPDRGDERGHPFCGVALGAAGSPFLFLFHQMEPRAPQGLIHIQTDTNAHGEPVWRLEHMDLPANVTQHKVLLFCSSCSSGKAECTAIEALCGVGCTEESITLVVLLVALDGIVNITYRFPQVKIITGGIESSETLQPERIVNGFGDFVSRYNSN